MAPVSNSEAIECLIKLRTHFQSLGGISETFSAIQKMKKTLITHKKLSGNFVQTRMTDAFPLKQIVLR